jgi:hypothetical protein
VATGVGCLVFTLYFFANLSGAAIVGFWALTILYSWVLWFPLSALYFFLRFDCDKARFQARFPGCATIWCRPAHLKNHRPPGSQPPRPQPTESGLPAGAVTIEMDGNVAMMTNPLFAAQHQQEAPKPKSPPQRVPPARGGGKKPAPLVRRQTFMEIAVPPDAKPGSTMTVKTPEGIKIEVRVPDGARPGQTVKVQV